MKEIGQKGFQMQDPNFCHFWLFVKKSLSCVH